MNEVMLWDNEMNELKVVIIKYNKKAFCEQNKFQVKLTRILHYTRTRINEE